MFTFWKVVILPIIGGALCQAFGDILRRVAVRKRLGATPPTTLQFLWMSSGWASVMLTITYLSIWGTHMPQVLDGFWRAVVCGALANAMIHFLNTKASSFQAGDVSLTGPLQAMTPGLITFLGVTLGEWPGLFGAIGMFLMMIGAYVLDYKKTPEYWSDYIGPLRRLRLLLTLGSLSSEERDQTIVVSLALASAAMGTLGLFFSGLYVRRGVTMQGVVLGLLAISYILTVLYAVMFLIRPDTKDGRRRLIPEANDSVLTGAFAFTRVGEMLLVQPTFLLAYIGYVGTLKRFSVLAKVILGHLMLKEGEFGKRMWAAFFIVIGAILISTDGLPFRVTTRIEGWGF